MKQIQLFQKHMLCLSFLLISSLGFSQVTEQWVKRYNGPGNSSDAATDMAVDAFGNVYVTGYSYGSGTGEDYATIKYDTDGNALWVRRYNSPWNGRELANSLAVDISGNVYVTGWSTNSNGFADYATVKYDAAGNERWVKRYNGSGNANDYAASLAVDASGNVYVTGTEESIDDNATDYATIKYDAMGNQRWVKRYNSPFGQGYIYDNAYSIAVDPAGNVYVTGESETSDEDFDYATIKYDTDGNELWAKRYNGPVHSFGVASSLAVDASGNVYVTGRSGEDYATVKYDAAGNELWVKRYNGGIGESHASSLVVDNLGNVYVTGYVNGEFGEDINQCDYGTIKYDAAGNALWVKRYDGAMDDVDYATSLAVDSFGNVYVTGQSGFFGVYATIKYDAVGNELWVKRYNSGAPKHGDGARSLAVDTSGNVYVTGNIKDDYTTIKYVQNEGVSVSSFTLINADTDEEIGELKDGDTIHLTYLSTLNLNIRANTNPATVGSVVFNLSGAQSRTHTENNAPYALFANNKANYYAWIPADGDYTLTATPYSEAKGKGEKGTALTIHFAVRYPVVSSFTLVNAQTDQDITTLTDGYVIDLSLLSTNKLNIRANTDPAIVGSVVFSLSGQQTRTHIENNAPYALFANNGANYYAWTPAAGNYSLTATPYGDSKGSGNRGAVHHITFTVVNQSITVQTNAANAAQKPLAGAAQDVGESLKATPNPFAGQTMVSFTVPKSGYTTVQVYDMKGVVVERLYQAWAEGGKTYRLSFNSKQLPSGVYMLRVATDKHVQSTKLVLLR